MSTVLSPSTTTTAAPPPSPLPSDVQSLTTWQDAFATHPLPGLRRLETQLRAQIAEHRARLRSLVGAHYRDLLGTADRIVEMHAHTLRAERIASDAGRRCNSALLERGVRNVAGLHRGGKTDVRRTGGRREGTLVAGKLLRAAIVACGRIVRAKGEALVAGKMLVLARLLLKEVEEEGEDEEDEEVVGELKRRLGRAREGLLEYISRRLGALGGTREETVDTLCAHALITSSAPADVLRFFLQVRLRQIAELGEAPKEGELLRMLELYRRTLLDVRDVFPRRFADGLAQLSKIALVKDAPMRAATGLSLDIYEHWITEDVRNFTPWFRHDQLSSSDVGNGLTSWAKAAQECLQQGLKDALEDMSNVEMVLELRHKVLSNFLSLSAKVRDQGHSQAIVRLRGAFLTRLEALAEEAAMMGQLKLEPQSSQSSKAMWDMALGNIDLDKGAVRFRQAIVHRQNGRNASTQGATAVLDEWTARLDGFQQHVDSMSTTRWDDDFDTDLDELEDGDAIQTALTSSDPGVLTSTLCKSTAITLRKTYSQIEAQSTAGVDAAFLIRIVREVDQRRRRLSNLLEKTEPVEVDESLVASLHRRVAQTVLRHPVEAYLNSLRTYTPTAVILWDGTPPLPIQSSPGTFRLLSALHRAMLDIGSDLWSPEAVHVLQGMVAAELVDPLGHVPDVDQSKVTDESASSDEKEDDAAEDSSESHDLRREQITQRLFDTLYLLRVLTSSVSPQLDEVSEKLTRELGLEETVVGRLRKNAAEYWRKTHLLFGFMVSVQRP